MLPEGNSWATYLQHIKNNMSFIDDIIGILAPHTCVGCRDEGKLLCDLCTSKLKPVTSRCYKCRRLTDESKTCKNCRSSSRLYRVNVGTVYEGCAKRLVWKLKYAGAQQAAKAIAEFMVNRIDLTDSIIIPIPTATRRVRQRGYDQAKLVAKHISKLSDFAYLDCLARSGQTHQIGASRQQRLKQLTSAYRLKSNINLEDMTVTLVDDVVTTGATLEAAAICLKKAGVKRVEAVIFAQA